jgi:hypothetical protein
MIHMEKKEWLGTELCRKNLSHNLSLIQLKYFMNFEILSCFKIKLNFRREKI